MTKATPQELEALAQEPTSADGAIARSALSAQPQDVVEGIVSLLKENIRIQVYGDDATAQIRDDNLTLCATAILASGLVTVTHPDEAAIRADERERCAKVAEESHAGIHDHLGSVARNIAAAIRAEDPMTLKVIR